MRIMDICLFTSDYTADELHLLFLTATVLLCCLVAVSFVVKKWFVINYC